MQNAAMPCEPEALSEVQFFQHLDQEDRAALAQVVDLIKVPAGDELFSFGDPGESLYVVRSGQIELYVKDNIGEKIVLSVATQGDLFGELALLDTGSRTASALALEESELFELDRSDLLLLFRSQPEAGLSMLAAVTAMTRKADELLRTRVSRNVNEEVEEQSTVIERAADWIAWFSGSIMFLILHTVWFATWVTINSFNVGIAQFDPFPFGLLTMIVSLEAIFLSCLVLISQNRQVEKDRVRSDVEYEVNVKAELEIAHLHEKTDRMYEQMLARFAQLERKLQ
jgi:uncharacterized membrane protein